MKINYEPPAEAQFQPGLIPLGAPCYQMASGCPSGAGCSQGLCQCSDNYVQAGSICIARDRIANRVVLPGAQCAQGDFCDGGSVCMNNYCQCPPGLNPQSRVCTPSLNQNPSCSNVQCQPPNVCQRGICITIYPQGSQNSLFYPGLSCGSNANVCTGGSYCYNGVCTCPSGYQNANGNCSAPVKYVAPGESCSRELDTIEIVECTGNSVCANGFCACPNGEPIQNGFCVSANSVADLGESCVPGVTQCNGNSICTGGTCGCQFQQVPLNGQCARVNVITANPNDPCSSNSLCTGNSYCNANRCTCLPGSYYYNGQCQFFNNNDGNFLEPGAPCGTSYPSCVQNAQCQEGMCVCQQGFVVYNDNCVPFARNGFPGDSCQQPGVVCVGGSTCTEGLCACSTSYTPNGQNCIPATVLPYQLNPGETCDSRCQYQNSCQQSCIGGSMCIDDICTCPQAQYVVNNQCIPQYQPLPPTVLPPSTYPTARPSERCNSQITCIGGSSCVLGICQCPPGYSPTADLSSCMNNLLVNQQAPSLPQALPYTFNSYSTPKCNKTIDCPLGRYCDEGQCKCSGGLIEKNGTCVDMREPVNSDIISSEDEEFFAEGFPGTECGLNQICLQNSECIIQKGSKMYCACPKKMVANSTGYCTTLMLSDSKKRFPGSKCSSKPEQGCYGNSDCLGGYCLCPENYFNNGNGFCLPSKMGSRKKAKSDVVRERRTCTNSTHCDDEKHKREHKVMKTVPPGSFCDESNGIFCSGGAHCFKKSCTCPFGHLIHDLSCKPAPRVSPGSSCLNGELCVGGSQCVNGICKYGIPGGLSPEETPQMVFLTFEGPVTDRTINIFKSLFNGKFRNPNNCPIKGTFFVSHEWNNYDQVQWLFSSGHEVAVNSITKTGGPERSISEWKAEMAGMREALERFSYVNPSKIIGVRAPKLAMGGDNQLKMMEQNRFLYDNSLAVEGGPFWPQTLDYRTSWMCPRDQHCTKESHPGMWQFPINELTREDRQKVTMLKSLVKVHENPRTLATTLMRNFNRSLETKKTPFLLTLDADFLNSLQDAGAVNALEIFLEEILGRKDTFVVTLTQAIEWMQRPTKLTKINNFTPWQCRYRIHQPIRPCENPSICSYPRTPNQVSAHSFRVCGSCPAVYPWINDPTGINQESIWNGEQLLNFQPSLLRINHDFFTSLVPFVVLSMIAYFTVFLTFFFLCVYSYRKYSKVCSTKTREAHRMLLMSICFQFLTMVILVLIPLGTAVLTYMVSKKQNYYVSYLVDAAVWSFPVVDNIVIVSSIRSYREFVVNFYEKEVKRIRNTINSVTPR
ncbi:hypothetical protein FO519_008491 [Halicephalobus sp. NKZ332]|nr:hypothetical protein FO519_008491 [Halicephalobus sp. NKZ332]